MDRFRSDSGLRSDGFLLRKLLWRAFSSGLMAGWVDDDCFRSFEKLSSDLVYQVGTKGQLGHEFKLCSSDLLVVGVFFLHSCIISQKANEYDQSHPASGEKSP